MNDDTAEELILVLQKCHLVSSEGCEIRVRGPFHRVRNFVFGVKKLELLDQGRYSIHFEHSKKSRNLEFIHISLLDFCDSLHAVFF